MKIEHAYDIWSDQYDTNNNKTRDLEAKSLTETLSDLEFDNCLEIGCGTGKNTAFLKLKATTVMAVDFSEKMLQKARAKINDKNVQFIKADITNNWTFATKQFDLITFSLVLEHIENLNIIFKAASEVASPNGYIYVGELHPFKQYTGSKARFETEDGTQILTCFNHNASDFIDAARNNGFRIVDLEEYYDTDDRTTIPRILMLLFQKN